MSLKWWEHRLRNSRIWISVCGTQLKIMSLLALRCSPMLRPSTRSSLACQIWVRKNFCRSVDLRSRTTTIVILTSMPLKISKRKVLSKIALPSEETSCLVKVAPWVQLPLIEHPSLASVTTATTNMPSKAKYYISWRKTIFYKATATKIFNTTKIRIWLKTRISSRMPHKKSF